LQVGQKIGEGSYAVVHRGVEIFGQQREVAIKIVRTPEELGQTNEKSPENGLVYEDVVLTMRFEMKVLQTIGQHPNIVQLFGTDEFLEVLVMEQGSSDLYDVVQRSAKDSGLPERKMRAWATDICAGVSFLHDSGFVHRDLKTHNILIFSTGAAKLCDFGLACKMPDSHRHAKIKVDKELSTLW
jgi:serine/threonine protein kinase